jgi:hypothetical protein
VRIKRKDRDTGELRKGACDERKKQRNKRNQEGAAEKPQREEKGEKGKDEMVVLTVSLVRADLLR